MSRKWLYLDYNTKNQKVRKKIKKFLYKKISPLRAEGIKGQAGIEAIC